MMKAIATMVICGALAASFTTLTTDAEADTRYPATFCVQPDVSGQSRPFFSNTRMKNDSTSLSLAVECPLINTDIASGVHCILAGVDDQNNNVSSSQVTCSATYMTGGGGSGYGVASMGSTGTTTTGPDELVTGLTYSNSYVLSVVIDCSLPIKDVAESQIDYYEVWDSNCPA